MNPSPATISAPTTIDNNGNLVTGQTAIELASVNPYLGQPDTFTGPATFNVIYNVTDALSPLVQAVTLTVTGTDNNPSPYINAPTTISVPFETPRVILKRLGRQ